MTTKFLDPDTQRPLAEWWKRALAQIIDWVVLAIPNWIFGIAIIGGFSSSAQLVCPTNTSCYIQNGGFLLGSFILGIFLIFVVDALYYVLLIGLKGQTLGMMALGIAVRDGQTDKVIGAGRALLRFVVITVLAYLFYIPVIIDFLSPLWDRRRQAWHDHAANSVVVDLR